MLAIAFILMVVTTDAQLADSRIDAITIRLAQHFNAGRMDAEMYARFFNLRTEAAELVTRWKWSGRGEWEARAAMTILNDAVRGVCE